MALYGFIGCGNMGGAIAKAIVKEVPKDVIYVSGKNYEKVNKFAYDNGFNAVNNLIIAQKCKFIFLGVKPQNLKEVISEIRSTIHERNDKYIVVSMAAGTEISKIQSFFGFSLPIIRIMPNTPVLIGKGMTLYSANEQVSADDEQEFFKIMLNSGKLNKIDELKIDAAGALTGCGPAYAYIFLEALADAAVNCGIPRALAEAFAAQTLLGSSSMLLETGKKPGELKDAVCSPGGTTIEGVKVLENEGFRSAVIDAVVAAYNKSKKL